MKNMHPKVIQAVLLAGGKGTRLEHLTKDIPKPMVMLQGKPFLEHFIIHLKNLGIKKILLLIGYKAQVIRNYFGDGSKWGVKIEYVEEKTLLGTAGPLKNAVKFLDDYFLCLGTDIATTASLKHLAASHFHHHNALVTLLLSKVEDTSRYGVVKIQGKKILDFVEKPSPKEAPSNLINTSMYVMSKKIVERIGNGFQMLEKDVFPYLAKEGRVFGHSMRDEDYFIDIGTLASLDTARKNAAEKRIHWIK